MSSTLHTVSEAAEHLRLHPKTVLRYIQDGRLPATRMGKSYRIRSHDLQALADEGEAPLPAPEPLARVTCVVDVPHASAALHRHLTKALHAALQGKRSGGAVQLQALLDPDMQTLKLLIYGGPGDTSVLLAMVERLLQEHRARTP